MAYSLDDRFPKKPKCYKLFDPGAYQNGTLRKFTKNTVPFLSNTPRNPQPGNKILTHAIYNTDIKSKVPNITSLKSKIPRFPYEAFSKEDLEEILCRCGFENPCECPVEEQEEEGICQAKVQRRLYKGPPPHSLLGESISVPSKSHRGYEIYADGSTKQLLDKPLAECPPFYDARVNEATEFYHGCKWSQWKSNRSIKSLEERPGPADYILEREPTQAEICAEKLRAYRRKYSKQLRFIEIVQNRNIAEGRPGPTDYDPKLPQGTEPEFYGPKAERFPTLNYKMRPGPATYWLRRTFDPPEIPECLCHSMLPESAGFGCKAPRFKTSQLLGPGPGSYSPNLKICRFMHCAKAAFGSSAARFKENPHTYEEEDSDIDDEIEDEDQSESEDACPTLTWEFKSKTLRTKPLMKNIDEPSPADLLLTTTIKERSPLLQYIAPFNSSEGRFQTWNDWMPVFGKEKTPGPCYYNLERPKCLPAVHHGPLCRAKRFPEHQPTAPAPNEYKVGGGIETVLATHNNKLKRNIENQHKFHWEPPHEPNKLSYEEQEKLLFDKAIAILDYDDDDSTTKTEIDTSAAASDKKRETVEDTKDATQGGEPKKLLRTFLYRKPIPRYY